MRPPFERHRVLLFALVDVDSFLFVEALFNGLALLLGRGFILILGHHVHDISFDIAMATRFVARGGDYCQHKHGRN
jgi:hypothetical protein